MADDLRCRACGALIAADASWCGQCYTPVAEPEPEPEPGPEPEPEPEPGEPAIAVAPGPPSPPAPSGEPVASEALPAAPPGDAPFWPCGVCGSRNPIDADACLTCGTAFASLMRDGPGQRQVDPRDAVRRSLLFPGLGHRLVGLQTEAFARGALFVVSVLMAVLLAATGFPSAASVAAFALFVLSAVGVYILSAVEVDRIARGGPLMIGARVLMWVVAGEVFIGVIVLAFAVVSASRR